MCMSLTIRYTWGAPKISGLMFWAERHGQRCSKNNYLDTCFVAFVNLVCQHCAQIGHGLLIKSKKIWIAAISMWKLSQPRGVLKIRGKSSPFSPAKCAWNSPKDINLASDELKKNPSFGEKHGRFEVLFRANYSKTWGNKIKFEYLRFSQYFFEMVTKVNTRIWRVLNNSRCFLAIMAFVGGKFHGGVALFALTTLFSAILNMY